MRPKFEVGEVVLLRGVSRPERNGECTILEVQESKKGFISCSTGRRCDRFAYKTTIYSEYGGWLESSLRKKHYPGDLTFEQLMSSLIPPKLLSHQPDGVVAP